jgi:hypothetical protein
MKSLLKFGKVAGCVSLFTVTVAYARFDTGLHIVITENSETDVSLSVRNNGVTTAVTGPTIGADGSFTWSSSALVENRDPISSAYGRFTEPEDPTRINYIMWSDNGLLSFHSDVSSALYGAGGGPSDGTPQVVRSFLDAFSTPTTDTIAVIDRAAASEVPDNGSTIAMLGCGLIGLAALRRRFLS